MLFKTYKFFNWVCLISNHNIHNIEIWIAKFAFRGIWNTNPSYLSVSVAFIYFSRTSKYVLQSKTLGCKCICHSRTRKKLNIEASTLLGRSQQSHWSATWDKCIAAASVACCIECGPISARRTKTRTREKLIMRECNRRLVCALNPPAR